MEERLHLAAIYIGPCDELVAREAVLVLLNQLKATHPGLDISHTVGLAYNKSTVLRYDDSGRLVATLENGERSNQQLTALDPFKKTLIYNFRGEQVINLLLGRKKDGTQDDQEILDPEWIPYNEESANRDALATILSVDVNSLLPALWYEIDPQGGTRPKAKHIRIPRIPITVEIPMSQEIAFNRSLEEDRDRGTSIFHTKFTTRPKFNIGAESDQMRVRVKNAFTYPIRPGLDETSATPTNYIALHKTDVLQHLATYNGGHAVEHTEERDKDGNVTSLIVHFASERAALIAYNLKGRGINVVDYRPPKKYAASSSAANKASTPGRYGSKANSPGYASSSKACPPRGGSRW